MANRAERRRAARLAAERAYRPPNGLEYNEFVGELRPPSDRAFTELHVRYGVRKNLYLDWSITLRARLGDIDEFRESKEQLERRTLEVVEVSDSAIRRHTFDPYEPEKPPQTTLLVQLQSGDDERVDAAYATTLLDLRIEWMQKHGSAAAGDRHNAAMFDFASKNRDPDFRNGDLSWVRNTLVSLSTDLVDKIISERAGFYFPQTPSTAGVLRTSGRMQFIKMEPGSTLPTDEAAAAPSETSESGQIEVRSDMTMGMLADAIFSGASSEAQDDWASWPPPWDGVSAKLEHAWRHFNLLAESTMTFIHQNPLSFETIAAPERGPNWLRCELHVTHPGNAISLMFGDFLHNLRCALDHSLTAIDPKAGLRANFPACLTEAQFENWAADWTAAGGSDGALAAIRARQPYHAAGGLDPEDYVLRIVARLNNADKHRLLNLTPVGVSDEKPPSLKIQSTTAVASYDYLVKHGYPLEEKQTALYIELEVPVRQASVQVDGTIPIAVSVDRYFDLVSRGRELHEAVVKTCHALRRGSLSDWADDAIDRPADH